MQLKEGASVYTSDGRKVGKIDRVVIDPKTKEVIGIAILKDGLLPEDKIVHISLIGAATEDRVTLRLREDKLDQLPEFEETHYIPLTGDDKDLPVKYSDAVYWYPPLGAGWWDFPTFLGIPNPPYAVETKRNIPEDAVPLKERAKVIAADNKHVGNVKEILTDALTDRVTHIIITEGVLFKEQKLIPISWVGRITEDAVYLHVTSKLLEDLHEYRPTP